MFARIALSRNIISSYSSTYFKSSYRLASSIGSDGRDGNGKDSDSSPSPSDNSTEISSKASSPFDFLRSPEFQFLNAEKSDASKPSIDASIHTDTDKKKGIYTSIGENDSDEDIDASSSTFPEDSPETEAMRKLTYLLNRSSPLRLEPALQRNSGAVFPDVGIDKIIEGNIPRTRDLSEEKTPSFLDDNENDDDDDNDDENSETVEKLSMRDVAEYQAEIRRLQEKGALPPPPVVPKFGEDMMPIEETPAYDDRLVDPKQFDFTRSQPSSLAPGEVTPWILKCKGRKQGKSGFSGRCEIFNEWDLHFQNIPLLKRFSSASAMILPRRRTGLCARCQRKVSKTIKRARAIGSIPYMGTYDVTDLATTIMQSNARETHAKQESAVRRPIGSKFKSLSWDSERGMA